MILDKSFCRTTLLLFLLLYNMFAFGNTSSGNENEKKKNSAVNPKKDLRKARKYFNNSNYIKAKDQYEKLLSIDSLNSVYNFEQGLTFFNMDNIKTLSIPYFEKSLANGGENTIGEVYYFLGICYHLQGKYSDAINAFEKYKNEVNQNGTYVDKKEQEDILKEINYRIQQCNNAILISQKPVTKLMVNGKWLPIKINSLGEKVNSKFDDYSPILSHNDSILFFTSRREGASFNIIDYNDDKIKEDVYYAKHNGNLWEEAQNAGKLINTNGHDASNFISANGKTFYLYKGKKAGTICSADFDGINFSNLRQLPKSDLLNLKSWETSIYVNKEETIMYFSSNRKGGYGGRDIYKTVKQSDGTWGKPENLGNTINSEYDEDAPYISSDGKTLYFSSNGTKSMGGFDVFKSVINNDKYETPENLGYPINSEADDIYFLINSKNDKCYYSSSKLKNNYSDLDIYEIDLSCQNIQKTKIWAFCNDTTLSVSIYDIQNKNNSIKTKPNADGSFSYYLKPETVYGFEFKLGLSTIIDTIISTPKQCDEFSFFQKITVSKTKDLGQKVTTLLVQNAFFDIAEKTKSSTGIDFINTYSNYISTPDSKTNENYSEFNKTALIKDDILPKTVFFKNVLFDFDKFAIRTTHKTELDSLANYLKQNPEMRIELGGHTDNKGSDNYNHVLSEKRSSEVKKYLESKGINANRISIKYFGKSKPFVPNTTATNRQLNRRVEILIIK